MFTVEVVNLDKIAGDWWTSTWYWEPYGEGTQQDSGYLTAQQKAKFTENTTKRGYIYIDGYSETERETIRITDGGARSFLESPDGRAFRYDFNSGDFIETGIAQDGLVGILSFWPIAAIGALAILVLGKRKGGHNVTTG